MPPREAPPARPLHSLRFADGTSLTLGPSTRVMGILNVTPDSFSDGGLHGAAEQAVSAAERMASSGADLIDVGGESTRPGAAAVDEGEECRRVLPVVDAIKRRLDIRVSVDTMKAGVASRAIEAGADLINDVSACSDPGMMPLLARSGTPVVLMHMRGDPRTMQRNTRYDDVVAEVVGFLRDRARRAADAGLGDGKLIVDPGIGFGKSVEGNLTLLRDLPALHRIGRPVLIGASRKSFIGSLLELPVTERLEGSLAVAALAAWNGAHILRVHDVAATVRAVRMVDAIRRVET